ncbi:hypothetical protein OIU79_006977 [Salix purpurea]|uniref:Uncharacterized protein n=1 Tax=Salix purpurea TaxID=77065 RepID=A0A9Q0TWN9_SALPP|nr:hypothetical protein OIU79_006977 [Salix purpurea]
MVIMFYEFDIRMDPCRISLFWFPTSRCSGMISLRGNVAVNYAACTGDYVLGKTKS